MTPRPLPNRRLRHDLREVVLVALGDPASVSPAAAQAQQPQRLS
jgi:hypothetical protein